MSPDYLCKSCGAMLEDRDIQIVGNHEQLDEPFSRENWCIPCGSQEVVDLEPVQIVRVLADLMERLEEDPKDWEVRRLRDFSNARELAIHLREVW